MKIIGNAAIIVIADLTELGVTVTAEVLPVAAIPGLIDPLWIIADESSFIISY